MKEPLLIYILLENLWLAITLYFWQISVRNSNHLPTNSALLLISQRVHLIRLLLVEWATSLELLLLILILESLSTIQKTYRDRRADWGLHLTRAGGTNRLGWTRMSTFLSLLKIRIRALAMLKSREIIRRMQYYTGCWVGSLTKRRATVGERLK